MLEFKLFTLADIKFTQLYRPTDACVFPYHCVCDDCLKGATWGAKMLSHIVDCEVLAKIVNDK